MPPRKKYKNESSSAFKKRMTKTGPSRKKANKAAKSSKY
tara:strand:+ start:100 stop:216 length:117 start_codon:yes stop_codon:yes gene_type:complete